MISMTVSIYFGMNDIMVNRYPYDTDISITGVGEEECQTAIETFEKAISDNKVPVDKKAEEIYLTIISRIDHGQIQIAEPGTLTESGSVLTLSLVRQSEYEKLTGTNPALQDCLLYTSLRLYNFSHHHLMYSHHLSVSALCQSVYQHLHQAVLHHCQPAIHHLYILSNLLSESQHRF